MDEASGYQLRRRRLSGNPNFVLNFEPGYQISEGKIHEETPSPSTHKYLPRTKENYNSARQEFRNKQQSFDLQIEDFEEEEILLDSDDEMEPEKSESAEAERPDTPTPVQDFGTNVVYTEGPQPSDFLQVKAVDHECVTDVSDADSEDGD